MSAIIALSASAAWAETRGAAHFVSGHPCRELRNRIDNYIRGNFHDRAEQAKTPRSGASKQEIADFNSTHPIAYFFHELQKLSSEAGQTAARGQCTEVEKRRLELAFSDWVRQVKQRHLTLTHDIDWAKRQQRGLQGLRGFDNGGGLFADFWRPNLASYDLSGADLGGGRYVKTGELRPIRGLNSLLIAPNPKTSRAPSQHQRLSDAVSNFVAPYLALLQRTSGNLVKAWRDVKKFVGNKYLSSLTGGGRIIGRFNDWRSPSRYRLHEGRHNGIDIDSNHKPVINGYYGRITQILPWVKGQAGISVESPDGTVITYGHVSQTTGLYVGKSVHPGDVLGITAIDHVDIKIKKVVRDPKTKRLGYLYVDPEKIKLPVDKDHGAMVAAGEGPVQSPRNWVGRFVLGKLREVNIGESLARLVTIANNFPRLARQFGLDLYDTIARIEIESNFRIDAVSEAGAQGLSQLMPKIAKWLGVTDPFQAQSNLTAGNYLMSNLLKKYHGNKRLALAEYNGGQKYMHTRKARDYAERVLRRAAELRGQASSGRPGV